MSSLAQIAVSYGLEHHRLAAIVGVDGVDPNADLSESQTGLIVRFIETSGVFATVGGGRHRWPV